MQKKGLCITCVHDKTCTFPRKLPVWQCEEFSEYTTELTKQNKHKKIELPMKSQPRNS